VHYRVLSLKIDEENVIDKFSRIARVSTASAKKNITRDPAHFNRAH
jgi:hypothetical protein